jgi:predicted DNA repair protein MutK
MVSAVGMVYLTTEAQNKVLKILAFKKKKEKKKRKEKKGPKRRRAQCFGPGDKRKKVNSEVFNPEVATLRKVRPEA